MHRAQSATATVPLPRASPFPTPQVIQQTVLDLLTAQCDRHSENVFITEDGSLTFIDNDRALGVVTRCGGDSMLLPGNRWARGTGVGRAPGVEAEGEARTVCAPPRYNSTALCLARLICAPRTTDLQGVTL